MLLHVKFSETVAPIEKLNRINKIIFLRFKPSLEDPLLSSLVLAFFSSLSSLFSLLSATNSTSLKIWAASSLLHWLLLLFWSQKVSPFYLLITYMIFNIFHFEYLGTNNTYFLHLFFIYFSPFHLGFFSLPLLNSVTRRKK
uniref:Uncharacterized protein n=1 Tax=Cacopsylla melanoneura TaxID=428564 RepID=A0A8D9F1I2_9HEMI